MYLHSRRINWGKNVDSDRDSQNRIGSCLKIPTPNKHLHTQTLRSCSWYRSLDLLEMVVVVELGRGQQGQVVTAVRDRSDQQSDGEPQTGGGHVWAKQNRTHHSREHVRQLYREEDMKAFDTSASPHIWRVEGSHHMLHRMSVERHHSDRSRPLVMDLMDALIERGMVNEPARAEESTNEL